MYILKRLLRLLYVWLALISLTFLMRLVIAGDPVDIILSQQQTDPQSVAALRHEFGLDRPLPIQYLSYIANVAHGDLGTSLITRRPVLDEISDRYARTVLLAVAGLIVAVVFGVGNGVVSVWIENKLFGVALAALNVVLLSMPTFWLGLLFFGLVQRSIAVVAGSGSKSTATTDPARADTRPCVGGIALAAGQGRAYGGLGSGLHCDSNRQRFD